MGKKQDRQRRLKRRYYSGYSEWRYGSGRPITLAGPAKHPPIFRGEKRRHVIDEAMDLMRDWRYSHFEFEGATRAGIRAALCLQGYGWHRSDQQTSEIVAEALSLLGAKRPTWNEGQPEYTTPRENCQQCRGPLDDTQIAHADRFCSAECAKIAITRRIFEGSSKTDQAYIRAYRVIWISRKPTLICEQCGKAFKQRGENGTAKFCSETCYYTNIKQRAPTISGECLYCESAFVAKHPKAAYCSKTCKARVSNIRRGHVIRISPPVLDYLFRQQGLRITCERVAA